MEISGFIKHGRNYSFQINPSKESEMNRASEKIYMYEKTYPGGAKKIIEMSESQIVKHMKRDLKYPQYKSRQDLITEFIAIYFAVDKNKWKRNEGIR